MSLKRQANCLNAGFVKNLPIKESVSDPRMPLSIQNNNDITADKSIYSNITLPLNKKPRAQKQEWQKCLLVCKSTITKEKANWTKTSQRYNSSIIPHVMKHNKIILYITSRPFSLRALHQKVDITSKKIPSLLSLRSAPFSLGYTLKWYASQHLELLTLAACGLERRLTRMVCRHF